MHPNRARLEILWCLLGTDTVLPGPFKHPVTPRPKVPRAPSSAVSCMGLGSPGHTGSNAGRDQQHELVGGKARLSPTSPGSLSLGRDPQSSSKHLVNKFQVTKNTLAKGMMCALVTWLLSSHSAVGSAGLADEEGSEGPVTGLCPSRQQPRAFWGSRELALAVTGLPRPQRSSPVPPGARSEQTGAGGQAGMIPVLIISVPLYPNAAQPVPLCCQALGTAGKGAGNGLRTRAAPSGRPTHRGSDV